jgi:hypothetical protein
VKTRKEKKKEQSNLDESGSTSGGRVFIHGIKGSNIRLHKCFPTIILVYYQQFSGT